MSFQFDKPREECGVFGVSLSEVGEAVAISYDALLSLQHRGQEGAGIAVASGNYIHCHKGEGLVSEVFTDKEFSNLPKGKIAIGHTLYSAAASGVKGGEGPFVTDYLTGRIATALNGKITNIDHIREILTGHGLSFGTDSDGEVVSSLIAYCITQEHDVLSGAVKAVEMLTGAYSLVVANGDMLIAIRDPYGFRPLCIGQNESGCAVASESCAFDICGFSFVRDVQPGEAVVLMDGAVTGKSARLKKAACGGERCGLCIFEYVYFARPDSVIDGLSVYKARLNLGAELAEEQPADADVVCGAPDTGLDAALGYSMKSGIPMAPGFVKNRYIGRTFIYPTQIQRENAVRLKLNPLAASVGGKRVVFVDDSIVRGTTTEKTVRGLKSAGALEVHVRISSPPFRHSCLYGTDIDNEANLIANKTDLDGIRRMIGADSLGYISFEGLFKACGDCTLPFCEDCFAKAD